MESDTELMCRIESSKFRNPPQLQRSEYLIEYIGIFPSASFEVIFYRNNETKDKISPWLDIPLKTREGACASAEPILKTREGANESIFNFICEVPKYTRSKLELYHETHTIRHNILPDKSLRFFRYGDNLFNYGFLPQTWEDPNIKFEGTEYCGDNDPLDAFEISDRQYYIGDIVKVKVVGGFYLIDQNETDWKILTIDIDHYKASLINDIDDVKREMPGVISAIREWLRVYKVYEGKELNKFYSEKPFNRETALKLIEDTHKMFLNKDK